MQTFINEHFIFYQHFVLEIQNITYCVYLSKFTTKYNFVDFSIPQQ